MAKRIAVFGPTHRTKCEHRPEQSVQPKILKCAFALGAAIAARDDLLLTGGDGSDRRSVKDAAIRGAEDKWVGVLPGGDSRPEDNVIPSGLRSARNLLEAFMCDAAIALYGGDGTRSEVACALALKRPIALVGCEWRQYYDLDGPDRLETATALLKDARTLLTRRTSNNPGFEQKLEHVSPARVPELLEWARRPEGPQCEYFDLVQGDALAEVVDWAARQRAPEDAPRGPEIQGIETAKRTTIDWLDHLRRQG